MEPDRLRAGRLPEDVVLKDPDAGVAGELSGETPGARREYLGGDDVVGLPRVAELARASSGSRPSTQLTSSGRMPVSYSPSKSLRVALAEELEPLSDTSPASTIRKPSRRNAST